MSSLILERKGLRIWDVLAFPTTKSMVGVSPFKGRRMDEILDAEYKVVEHQIARPLDPSPRWRFQHLARDPSSTMPATPIW
jgi:hypothetical protein